MPKPARETPAAYIESVFVVEVENFVSLTPLIPISAAQITLPFASVLSLPLFPSPEQAELPRVEKVNPPPVKTTPFRVDEAVELMRDRDNPPPKVEVAVVDVAMKVEALTESANTPLPVTPRVVPGVVVPIPTLPFESTVRAVVVAPLLASAKTENKERLEREEVAVTVSRELGELVPTPTFPPPVAKYALPVDPICVVEA